MLTGAVSYKSVRGACCRTDSTEGLRNRHCFPLFATLARSPKRKGANVSIPSDLFWPLRINPEPFVLAAAPGKGGACDYD